MFIPLRAHVPMDRRPWANYAILLATITCSVVGFLDPAIILGLSGYEVVPRPEPAGEDAAALEYLFPRPPTFRQTLPAPVAAVTSTLVHAGWAHLAANMLFLWVFGNAVNYKLGQGKYVLLYVLAALVSGLAHHLLRGGPAVGASGAVYGVVGVFLVFFPRNDVTAVWFYAIFWLRTFTLSSVWVILYWVGWDVLFLVLGSKGRVGYEAHVGGFATGFALGLLLAAGRWVRPHEDEQTLLQLLGIPARSR